LLRKTVVCQGGNGGTDEFVGTKLNATHGAVTVQTIQQQSFTQMRGTKTTILSATGGKPKLKGKHSSLIFCDTGSVFCV